MTKLNILYIHGFGSRVDLDGDKQVALRKIANVSAFAPNYPLGYQKDLAEVEPFLQKALPVIEAHADIHKLKPGETNEI